MTTETERLEGLWSGEFGDEYVDRNLGSYEVRAPFWRALTDELAPAGVLEVGCNVGGNLQWMAGAVPPEQTFGVDVNRKALELMEARIPGVQAVLGSARTLPFDDASIDLVFTMGVLIHQPEESLPAVMDEMVRVSRRYLLCGEYFDTSTVEVAYRGHEGALFRRDYGALFESRFPDELEFVRKGFLGRDAGWDDITWWLFRRR